MESTAAAFGQPRTTRLSFGLEGDFGVDELVLAKTEMYAPVPVESAPATSRAWPVSAIV